MPTMTEWDELSSSSNCNWEWADNYNGSGIKGYIVTSKKTGYTGNSIFLPAAGHRNDMEGGTLTDTGGTQGNYWTSSLHPGGSSMWAWRLQIRSSDNYTTYGVRPYGFSVRAVTE